MKIGAGLILFFLSSLFFPQKSVGETTGGRGGLYLDYHLSSMERFTPVTGGQMLVFGGSGFGTFAKGLRLGGGGGVGFLFLSTGFAYMGLGYGGLVVEYVITDWFTLRGLIGGGGFGLTLSNDTLASGGFLVLYPGMSFEFPLSALKFSARLGYFAPSETRLLGLVVGAQITIGTN